MHRRLLNKIIKLAALLPAICIIVAQRALLPIVQIRTSGMDTSRIGWFHILNWHLRTKIETHSLDIFFEKRSLPKPANEIFLKMWTKRVRTVKFRYIWEMVHRINQALPSDKFTLDLPKSFAYSNERFVARFQNSTPLSFTLTESEIVEAKRQIREMLPSNEFICFHNRDAGFLNANLPEFDWSYHDHRDSNIQLYAPAIKCLANSGLSCIRLGTVASQALQPDFENSVIKYQGTEKQNDLLDIYFASHCKFFITTDSGVIILPYMFGRPIVLLNWTNLVNVMRYMPNTIFIPKLYRSLSNSEYFDFYDMLYGPVRDIASKKQLDEQGAVIVENTSEDIFDAVSEMQLRLSGKWRECSQDDVRQEKFWRLFGKEANRCESFRLSTNFLKKHENLLDRSYEKYTELQK